MALQLLEEEEGEAWATSALLDSVGFSTKPFGRQVLAETGFVSTAEPCLSGTQKSELTGLPKRYRNQKIHPKVNTKQTKIIHAQIVSLSKTTVISSIVAVIVFLS